MFIITGYWWAIQIAILFLLGTQILKFRIFVIYNFSLFFFQFWCLLCLLLNGMHMSSAFGGMSTDLLFIEHWTQTTYSRPLVILLICFILCYILKFLFCYFVFIFCYISKVFFCFYICFHTVPHINVLFCCFVFMLCYISKFLFWSKSDRLFVCPSVLHFQLLQSHCMHAKSPKLFL